MRRGFTLLLLLVLACCGMVMAQTSLPPGASLPDDADHIQTAIPSAASPLAQAEDMLANGNYARAKTDLDAYLSAHPKDARALFDRGYVEDAQGKTADAAEYYRKAVAADPKQFEARLALGLILAAQNSPEAREQLQAATQLEPNPPNPKAKAQAYGALARVLLASDPQGASDALLKKLAIAPETPDDMLLGAEIAVAEGDDADAEGAYRRVLQIQPESPDATAGLVHLLLKEKKYADAEPLLKASLGRDPDDPALNAQLAAAYAAEGKQADAVSLLEKLHRLKPQDIAISSALADAYVAAGEDAKAEPIYQELSQRQPENAELLDSLGQLEIRQKQYAEAISTLQQGVAHKPDDPDAWAGIAFAASETKQPELQLQALSMRSKYAPDTAPTYFLWATAYDTLHQRKPAADYYRKFLAAAQGKFPDQEWQAKHRLVALGK